MLEKMVLLKTSSGDFKDHRIQSEGWSRIESFDFLGLKTKKTEKKKNPTQVHSYKTEADYLWKE